MLSRVAENIYWLIRYIERAENTARLIHVNNQLILDTPRGINPGWEPMVYITGQHEHFTKLEGDVSERDVVSFLIGNRKNPGSILSSLHSARENFRTVREVLPRSAWEIINELYHYAQDNVAQGVGKKGRDAYLNEVIAGSQRLGGLLGSVMYRDEAYHFQRIGRHLERADMTTRILDVRSTDLFDEDLLESRTLDTLQWISVLKSLSCYQSYRRHVQIRVQRSAALYFLLKEEHFPRSVIHCIGVIEESISALNHSDATIRHIQQLNQQVKAINTASISQQQLHDTMDEIQVGIVKVHNSLAESYFSRSQQTQTQSQSQSS